MTGGHSPAFATPRLLSAPCSLVAVGTPLWGSYLPSHFWSQLWLWHLPGASVGSLEVLMPPHLPPASWGCRGVGLPEALERRQGREEKHTGCRCGQSTEL